MAYISFQPKDHYNTKLYTGNASTNAITGVGFGPAMTWFKARNATGSHAIFDALRTTYSVSPSNSAAEYNSSGDGFTSLDSDGFTLNGNGGGGGVNSALNYVTYNWKGGSTTIPSGSTATVQSYSINPTAGIGVYKYQAPSPAGKIIKHGLGRTPQFVMVKNIGTASTDWACYHSRVDGTLSEAGDFFLRLNTTAPPSNNSGYFHDTVTTSTDITLATDTPVGGNGNTLIMYAFANVDGFSRFGKYMGNVQVNGGYVHLGFTPAFVMIKSTGTRDWFLYDNKRPMNAQGYFNPNQNFLTANGTGAESNNVNLAVDFLSNGFKIRTTAGDVNGDGDAILYMAFAEHPVISSNGKSATAR